MKKILNITFLLLLVVSITQSCRKKESKFILQDPGELELVASTTDIVTDSTKPDDEVLIIQWGKSNYGPDIPIKHTLEVDKSGLGTFLASNTSKDSLDSSFDWTWTNKELNDFWLSKGQVTDTPSTMNFRVKYEVILYDNSPQSVAPAYSNVVDITVTPWNSAPPPPDSLFLAGDFQGWDPASGPTIFSYAHNGVYEGLVEFVKSGGPGSNEFKFVSQRDWNGTNYGAGASAGELSTSGGNLMMPAEGTYKFKVDVPNLTWSYSLENWGIIGNAVPVVQWNSDSNMVYDASLQLYTITIDLLPGEFKFRKNDDWADNFGSDGANDGDVKPLNNDPTPCKAGGKNFGVAAAGNYTLMLDPEKELCYVKKN